MNLRYEVQGAVNIGGVDARVTEAGPGAVNLDGVVRIALVRGRYAVLLLGGDGQVYQHHGEYDDLAVAVSEAVEHLVRYRLLGGHFPAKATGAFCEYEDCDQDVLVVFPESGQKFCGFHGAMAALMEIADAVERVRVVRAALSVPEWRRFQRDVAKVED